MDGTASKVNQPIRVQNLNFAYARVPILSEVTFTLERGAVGLLGPNGSGKTTLLRALLGHLRLPAGMVHVLDQDMAQQPRRGRKYLGWMPERGGIIPGMSGVALVAYLGQLAGMPLRDAMQRAHEVLDYVGLGEARYRKCEDYSQGMRQRLKLAQALVHDPAWILLDEPTSGLDPKGRIGILDLVKDLTLHKGIGVILATHLLADVEAVCEQILVLRKGRLLAHESIDRVAKTQKLIFEVEGFGAEEDFLELLEQGGAEVTRQKRLALVTLSDGGTADVILQAAAASGYALRRLRRQTLSLEDIFFKLVQE